MRESLLEILIGPGNEAATAHETSTSGAGAEDIEAGPPVDYLDEQENGLTVRT